MQKVLRFSILLLLGLIGLFAQDIKPLFRILVLVLFGALGLLTLPLCWMQMSGEQKSRVAGLLDQTPPGRAPTGST